MALPLRIWSSAGSRTDVRLVVRMHTGVYPSVLVNYVCCGFVVLVISKHDLWTSDADFACLTDFQFLATIVDIHYLRQSLRSSEHTLLY